MPEGIFEAATRPTMRFVPVKNIVQQDLQSLHRMREQLVGQRTSLINLRPWQKGAVENANGGIPPISAGRLQPDRARR